MICSFLCATFSGNGQENHLIWMAKACELYSSGQYNDAAVAYERAIFSDTTGAETCLIRLMKTDCYKQTGNFQRALKELETIFLPSLPDSVKFKVIYQKALCNYLNHTLQEAEAWIEQFPAGQKSTEIMVLEILIFSDLFQSEKAKEQMVLLIEQKSSGLRRDSLLAECNQLYRQNRLPRLKKEKTAALLSTFFPGAGQLYTGYIGRGALAFAVTTGSIGVAVIEVMHGVYFTGYVIGLGFFQKFYFGGIEQSRRLTGERNSKIVERYNESVKKLVFSRILNLL